MPKALVAGYVLGAFATLREEPDLMAKSLTLYGIKNCDTMKKARNWLDEHAISYTFHDYKADGITADSLKAWMKAVGWEVLLNRAGTTFRKLPDAEKTGIDEEKARALMLAQPAMIKRPVLTDGARVTVGFKPELYAKALL